MIQHELGVYSAQLNEERLIVDSNMYIVSSMYRLVLI